MKHDVNNRERLERDSQAEKTKHTGNEARTRNGRKGKERKGKERKYWTEVNTYFDTSVSRTNVFHDAAPCVTDDLLLE